MQAALQWANRRGDMYFTRVQVEDAAGEALARKLQFKPLPGKAGVWITERPRAKWLAGYLLVGLMIGLMIGQLMKAATQGTIIGAGVGLVLGVVLFRGMRNCAAACASGCLRRIGNKRTAWERN